jgi:hypothetical protein
MLNGAPTEDASVLTPSYAWSHLATSVTLDAIELLFVTEIFVEQRTFSPHTNLQGTVVSYDCIMLFLQKFLKI